MSTKLTESRLRQIIREEASRLLREGETFALKPGNPMPKVGDRIPVSSVTRGMSDIEGPGAERARAAAAKNRKPLPKVADTFLIYTGGTDPEFGGPSGMAEYYIGSKDDVGAFAAGEPVKLKPAPVIGTQRQWDNHMNGGPNPIAVWLKKHPEIRYVLDQDYPDPFGANEFFDAADWIAEQEDAEFKD